MKKAIILMILLLVSAAVFANGAGESTDATWAKTVDIVVPAKAGGGTDVIARTLFEQVKKAAGNNVGVVNNDTGNCVVAFEEVRNAEADGSKILFFNGGFLTRIASGIYDKKVEDFKVIAVAHGENPSYALVVSATSPIKTLDDLKAAAQAGEILFGGNQGGTTQVMASDLAKALGVNFKFVHCGADTDTLTALVGGSIDVCYANINQVKQYAEAGKATVLGVLGQDDKGTRSPILPEVPNLIELGANVNFAVFMVVLGPKTMPDSLAEQIHDYIAAANESEEVKTILQSGGLYSEIVEPYDKGEAMLLSSQESYVNAFK